LVKEIPDTYYDRGELLKFLHAYGFSKLRNIAEAMRDDYEWR